MSQNYEQRPNWVRANDEQRGYNRTRRAGGATGASRGDAHSAYERALQAHEQRRVTYERQNSARVEREAQYRREDYAEAHMSERERRAAARAPRPDAMNARGQRQPAAGRRVIRLASQQEPEDFRAQQYARANNQAARSASRLPVMPASQPYQTFNQPQRRGLPLLPIAGIVAVIAVIVVAIFIINPFNNKITVNGVEQAVAKETTIADLIEDGYASPKPGNLMAVDGSVATEGGGDAFAATINGEETTDPLAQIPNGAEVEIKDGADTQETFKTSEKTIKHGAASDSTSAESYWAGSLHVYSDGKDGVMEVKTGDVSGKTVEEVKEPAVDAGYSNYTANVGDDKVVALTFDDGPWPDTTKQLLDIFEANNAKCTFFTIGNQISSYADQVKRAAELGCQVCTHTWDHADGSGEGVNLTLMSQEEQIDEVQKGYQAIKDATGTEPEHIMRAPGGNYYGDLISTLAPYVKAEIGWDVDTEDWRKPGWKTIYKRIMSVKPGQVILMHDGGGDRAQTVKAVKKAVPELIAKGYQLVTVDDLLAYGTPGSSPNSNASESADTSTDGS